ncbi:hypothetical protein M231_07562 [Tremella mesenterica]|uniref:Dystroglycan-type cadherin-like domain-containing protein n=1 Tax=Tremella mesenterica TaxID=5217 RepID=A0A4Q1BFJ9_TREME|nr:hypothetical protein M231_07562 [Tremella mesenterica]
MIALVLVLAAMTTAKPILNYPMMDQMPFVARIGQPFTFDLFPSSFTSTTNITYTTSTLPSWLSFSPEVETFHGTPSAVDVGEQTITLTATDDNGSTKDSFKLIVTKYSTPAVHAAFTTQLASTNLAKISSATTLPDETGVSIPPHWSFSLGFQYDTFRVSRNDPNNGELYFSAHQRGTIGLPDWLNFNNETFTFDGVAPANGSYTIVATGTDFWGYTGAQTSFVIEVGVGDGIELIKGKNFTAITTMARDNVDYKVDVSDLVVGGAPAKDVVFSIDDVDFPWLKIDSSSGMISGITPDKYQNGTITSLFLPLTIASSNSSSTLTLTTWVGMNIIPYFFTAYNLPDATVAPGEKFSFDISPYVANSTATISANSTASWLTFSGTTVSGTVPKDFNNVINVVFSATLGDLTSTSTLKIETPGAVVSTTSGSSTPTDSSTNLGSGSHRGLSKAGKIALGVIFGLLALILLLLLLFCCFRRRKAHQEEREEKDDASFVAASPITDPFRRSNTLEPPRNILGEIAKISLFHHPEPRSPDRPSRMEGLKGIFGWSEKPEKKPVEEVDNASSFAGSGVVIGISDPIERPSQDASSFTQSFSSGSRASWESRESFQWSMSDKRLSTPSVPRPRADFTPRYPRNSSPTRLAQLASQHTLGSPEFSEFHSSEEGTTFQSGSLSSFAGPAASRFGGSGFQSIDEEDETSGEDAVVAMAERQSFETRQPIASSTPRLRPSVEKIASPEQSGSRKSIAIDGAFDDAEEARRSMYTDASALGYPNSEIMFGSPMTNERSSFQPENRRISTVHLVPQHETPLSPPLPQVGSFVRHRRHASGSRPISTDGRLYAASNETFSIHPPIHPPPSVSLSAVTWSSNPPSTYRAELEGGGPLPTWLHFDARELELWGVPALKHAGEVMTVVIIEKMPMDKRRSDPMAYGYQPRQDREVGRVVIEVVDRLRSPPFGLEGSPHAL